MHGLGEIARHRRRERNERCIGFGRAARRVSRERARRRRVEIRRLRMVGSYNSPRSRAPSCWRSPSLSGRPGFAVATSPPSPWRERSNSSTCSSQTFQRSSQRTRSPPRSRAITRRLTTVARPHDTIAIFEADAVPSFKRYHRGRARIAPFEVRDAILRRTWSSGSTRERIPDVGPYLQMRRVARGSSPLPKNPCRVRR